MLYKMPDGTIVILSGEKQAMIAEAHGWERVMPDTNEDGVKNAPREKPKKIDMGIVNILDLDQIQVNAPPFKRRATTARFTIDPKTGHIIPDQE